MTTFPYGITITLLREQRDRTGDTTLVEDRVIEDCGWSPAVQGETDNAEFGTRRVQTVTGRTLYLPPDSGLLATHRVRFPDNTLWEVVGEIGMWQSPLTGWYPGDQAELRRVTG